MCQEQVQLAQFSSISNMGAKMQLDSNFEPTCGAKLELIFKEQ